MHFQIATFSNFQIKSILSLLLYVYTSMVSTRHDVFLMVALQKSFSKASHVLYISQPAISRHIKTLEEYYHTKLFNRSGAHISLTAAGQLLLERLTQVKAIQQQTEHEIAVISTPS